MLISNQQKEKIEIREAYTLTSATLNKYKPFILRSKTQVFQTKASPPGHQHLAHLETLEENWFLKKANKISSKLQREMGRAPCCDKANVKKGPWSPEEDAKLKEFIEKYGTGGNWIALPHKAGLKRCGKSCRLRWLNYLRPNIKHGEFSDGEDRIICNLFANIGSRWSIIASQLPGRTDNDIKNYWNTKLKKKLIGTVPFPQRKPSQPSFLPHLSTVSSPSLSTLSSYTQKCLTEPISIPSNLLNNTNISTTATTSLLQAQESFVDPTNQYQMQDNLLMFGGEPSCSSSDGSCNQINYGKDLEGSYFYDRVEENQKFINGGGTGGGGVDGWTEKPNGMWGGTPLDYGHDEEIKQLISSNAFNNFFVDENKAQARAMYY